MKLGILTYHRAHNYGAILQAIATRVVLQKKGHEVHYVDYYPAYHREIYRQFSWKALFRQRKKYLKHRIRFWRAIRGRIACFERDIAEHIAPFCWPYGSAHSYDVMVYGSDQIWRKQTSLKNFNPVYFGENTLQAKRHVTYAASMGVLQQSPADREFLKHHLCHFSALSVREKDLQAYLAELGFQADLVSDPTLLLTGEEWDAVLHPRPLVTPGYVLFYSLHEKDFDRAAIRQYADARHLRVVEIKGEAGHDTDTVFSQCGAWDFVSLIKQADCVFTTSYHGLVFSLIYHKDFFCSFSKNSGRAQSLLNFLCLQERMVDAGAASMPSLPPVDYRLVDDLLKRLRTESLTYLDEALRYASPSEKR